MRKNKHYESKVLGRTMLAVVAFILLAALMNQTAMAEESSPIDISSQSLKTVISDAQKVTPRVSDNPLQLGVTPLFGVLQSADNNQLLLNKYSAGFAAEIKVSPNVSVEGIFRYGEYNVRPDLVMMNFAAAQVASGMGEANPLDRLGISVIGAMTQTMLGGNVKYELYPDSILTPYVGGGVVHFNNDYHTDSQTNFVKITLPQSVYAANALGGMKLKLSQKFSILCRAEAGSLLNNRNGSIYWGPYGQGGQVYSYHNFRSYDKYWSGLVGMSFGM